MSPSLGLNESEVRSERFYHDKQLAESLRVDLISFMNEWENNVLFKNQKVRNKTGWEEQKKNRLLHGLISVSTPVRKTPLSEDLSS